MKEDKLYKKARRRVREIKEFYSHLLTYIVVNTFLIAINLITSPGNLWFYWVTLGWGIGLVCHALSVFGIGGIFGTDWEERKIKEYIDKEKQNEDNTEK